MAQRVANFPWATLCWVLASILMFFVGLAWHLDPCAQRHRLLLVRTSGSAAWRASFDCETAGCRPKVSASFLNSEASQII
jgi:hypothetical protein